MLPPRHQARYFSSMHSKVKPPVQQRWTALWMVAGFSLVAHLALCQFFSFGRLIPVSIDMDPSNLWKYAYTFPPSGTFQVFNWLGIAQLPLPLNPCSLAANLPAWWFFTTYAPVIATLSLLAMAAFLRELEVPRPAALFGGVVYAWQGDLIPFVLPGHYAYMTTWPFFALAAWAALRAQRTRLWPYALICGASTGLMVGLQPDRGAIASLLIAALYLAPAFRDVAERPRQFRYLAICVGAALIISLAAFCALFKGNIAGVKLGGQENRETLYQLVTQYSLGPKETLTYLIPGFFGWHSSNLNGPYWGEIGRTLNWPKESNSTRNFNLAISSTGTIATVMALFGIIVLLSRGWLGPGTLSDRQRFFGKLLLLLGGVALVLSWGYHTPFYRPLFALPLMDKWRNPLKWLEMTNFALAVLSAFGAQQLLATLSPSSPADAALVRRRVTLFSGGLLIFFGLGVILSYPFAAYSLKDSLASAAYDPGTVANIMATMIFSLQVAFGLMVLFCLLLWAVWKPEALRRRTLDNPMLHRLWQQSLTEEHLPQTLAVGLILLCAVQMAWVDTQFLQPTDIRVMTDSNDLLEKLKSEGDRVRVAVPVQDPILNILLQNQFYADRISCLDISAASRIPNDLSAFLGNFDDDPSRLWFLAGVKNVVVPESAVEQMRRDTGISNNVGNIEGYMLAPGARPGLPSHAMLNMRFFMDKATLVPEAEVLPTDQEVLRRLKDPRWNPRASVVFSSPPPDLRGKTDGDPRDNSIELKTYTPTKIVAQVHSSDGGYVLINDQFDPDWEATVNGRPAGLLRADFILRAIAVPPGDVTVNLDYVAHYTLLGITLPALAVNLFSDAAMIAAWLVAAWLLGRKTD